MNKFSHYGLLFFIVVLMASCKGGEGYLRETAAVIEQTIAQKATAASGGSDSGSGLATVEALATLIAEEYLATQIAAQAMNADALTITQTAEAPFVASLVQYGVDPTKGRMGWIHPPVTLDIQGYMQYDYLNYFLGTIAKDFVVSADLTLNTGSGVSGCGFVLRSDGNQDALSQYLALFTRSGNGRVIFSTMDEGEVKNVIDRYAYSKDPLMDFHNGATNNLTVVARDEVFTLYTNGTKVGEVTAGKPPVLVLPPPPTVPPPGSAPELVEEYDEQVRQYENQVAQMQASYQQNLAIFQPNTPYYERGFIALVGLSEADRNLCTFENAWMWIIEE